MPLDYDPNDLPDDLREPDGQDVSLDQAVRRIIKELELQESEDKPNTVYSRLWAILETYDQELTSHNTANLGRAADQLKLVCSKAKALRVALATLDEGARAVMNHHYRSLEARQLWEQAGGKDLPQEQGPNAETFDPKKDDAVWDAFGSKRGFLGRTGYSPSPIEVQLKRIEELAGSKQKKLRVDNKNVGKRSVGDVIHGSPRHLMVHRCLLMLGTSHLDIEKLLPLVQLVQEITCGPILKKTLEPSQWGKDDVARAIGWWRVVGPYWGKPKGQIPMDIIDLINAGWGKRPRRKTNKINE